MTKKSKLNEEFEEIGDRDEKQYETELYFYHDELKFTKAWGNDHEDN